MQATKEIVVTAWRACSSDCQRIEAHRCLVLGKQSPEIAVINEARRRHVAPNRPEAHPAERFVR